MNWLTNVRLPNPLLTNPENNLWRIELNEQQIIHSVVPMSSNHESLEEEEDWMGDFLSPMAIDLQINGGLGLAFSELEFQDLPKLYALFFVRASLERWRRSNMSNDSYM